jgi:hypothetical protein
MIKALGCKKDMSLPFGPGHASSHTKFGCSFPGFYHGPLPSAGNGFLPLELKTPLISSLKESRI